MVFVSRPHLNPSRSPARGERSLGALRFTVNVHRERTPRDDRLSVIPNPDPSRGRGEGSLSFVLRCALALFLLGGATRSGAAVDEEGAAVAEPAYPEAGELLAGVLKGLPNVPVAITAQLQSKNRNGDLEKALTAEMQLDWRGRPPTARYTIRDAFGGNVSGLNITWRSDGTRDLRYFTGPALVAGTLPALDTAIEGTDITWMDLSLSFLWWTGGRTVGSEKIKGRSCYVVDLPAPSGSGSCTGARLWIDPEIHLLLQAAMYDRQGQLLRLLEVKSFKKVRDLWIIQNIDVQSFPVHHKTSLRVRQAEAPEAGSHGKKESD